MFEPKFISEDLIYFDDNHEGSMVKSMARGMSMSEVANFFGAELSEVTGEDMKFLKYWYKQGRAAGNSDAVTALFDQMRQRGGGQVALSYLARFADDWVSEIEADGETKGKKTFRVVLD